MTGYTLTQDRIAEDLHHLARNCPAVAKGVAGYGMPEPRQVPTGFASLMRIMVGQMISVKAAAGIWTKLEDYLGQVTPDSVLAADDLPGLSGAKKRYARGLAERVANGSLDLGSLRDLDDETAFKALTEPAGFGPWSAHIYLMFALGRPDIWPAGDLAVRAGYARLHGLEEAPDIKQVTALAEPYRPRRSAVALLCWHIYNNPPL